MFICREGERYHPIFGRFVQRVATLREGKRQLKRKGYSSQGSRMALDKNPEIKKFKCEGEGCKKSSYHVCKELSGAEGLLTKGIGLVGADFIVTDARRTIGALEAWVDPGGTHTQAIDTSIGIATGAAIGTMILTTYWHRGWWHNRWHRGICMITIKIQLYLHITI